MYAHSLAIAAMVESRLGAQLERMPPALAHAGANGRYLRAARARLAEINHRFPVEEPSIELSTTTDRIVASAIAASEGRLTAALALAAPVTAPDEPPRTRAAALLLSAAALLATGDRSAAADSFVQAHALVEDERGC